MAGPGDQVEVQDANGDIGREPERGSHADGIHMYGKRCGKGSATSAAHRDSKRVKTNSLAEASKPLPSHPRRHTEPANPPHRLG
ncbi:hypothetical protein L210DRAFT_947023 [Boletus edulis BED1]|uniref:Uncharacterized protein n=1 Tax=Boletus edulis BED1 TaxID=1328754 RepID=A0AAD4BN39_BOLED|nr:hypothetical protein L210DRAFT_947023 [Boletus edulis BED1]